MPNEVPNQAHLTKFNIAWQNSSLGKPALLLLEGAAGIGKSHALRSFGQAIGGQVLVLQGSVANWITSVLRSTHTQLESERDPVFLEAARRFAPELRWAQVAQAPASVDQQSLNNALAHALERLARRLNGLVLLLEDVHEASADDLGALRAFYRRVLLGKAPVMLVLTSRPTESAVLEGFEQDAAIAQGLAPERLPLSSLDESGVNALVREHLHSEFLPDNLGAWLFQRAEGHPLHTLELLRYLQEGNALRLVGPIWVFRPPIGKAVPLKLEAVLKARLQHLQTDSQAWKAMTALSIMDRCVNVLEWSRLLRQSQSQILEVAQRLEFQGLVREKLELGETVFEIAHPLYAPLVKAQISSKDLLLFHGRGVTLAQNSSEQARHARASGHERSQEFLEIALHDAEQRFAYSDVIEHAEHLIALNSNNPNLHRAYVKALFIHGDTERALEASLEAQEDKSVLEVQFHILMRLSRFSEALATATRIVVLDKESQAERNQALALMHLERFDEAHEIVATLLHQFPEPSAQHGKTLDILSDIVYSQGDLRASLEFGMQAATMLREFHDEANLAITLTNLGGCCGHFGLWAQGKTYLEEAIGIYEQGGQLHNLMFAKSNLGFLMVESGVFVDARALNLSVVGQAHASKEARVESATLGTLADLEWQSGNLELAWQYQQQSLNLEQRESQSLVDSAHIQALRGNITQAFELIHAPQIPFHSKKTSKRTRIALLAGQFQDALKILHDEQSVDDHETLRAEAQLQRGLAYHQLGQILEAKQQLTDAIRLAELGQHKLIKLEAQLALHLINHKFEAAKSIQQQLEALDARGRSLTIQELLPSQWAQLQKTKPEIGSSSSSFLRTLGSFSLERDGKTTPWRASKTRELLALLLVAYIREDGPSVPKAQLIDTLWVDSSGDQTTENTFRVTVKRLRKSLEGAATIYSSQGIYELRDLNADVVHFLGALKKLDFDAALGWYKGAFLPDIDVPNLEIVRAQLWQRFRDTTFRASLEQPALAAANMLEKLHHLEPLDVEVLERLTQHLQTINDSFRLEQTLSRAHHIFRQETGEVPVELLMLEQNLILTS